MINYPRYPVDSPFLVIDEFRFEIGDLVTTVLGKYGIIVGSGKHAKYNTDNSFYYYVLVEGNVQHFLPFALIKIKNNIDNK